jgi:hypothetical protein
MPRGGLGFRLTRYPCYRVAARGAWWRALPDHRERATFELHSINSKGEPSL